MELRYEMAGSPGVREFLESHDAAVVARRGELVDARTRPAIVLERCRRSHVTLRGDPSAA
jgi:hypothetical protein